MTNDGYSSIKPSHEALYWMRRVGSVDGGRVVQIVLPDKYKLPHDEQRFPLPEGYEYKLVEGEASSY